MATHIYSETPFEESGCPTDNGAIAAYEAQLRDLSKIRDMSATLF